jgi:thioredoxin reductase
MATMNEAGWDVVIVGGGATGLAAALMLGRARRHVVVVDGGEPRNRFTTHMHGVLGHDGLDPAQLLATGRRELSRYGVGFLEGSVGERRRARGGTGGHDDRRAGVGVSRADRGQWYR